MRKFDVLIVGGGHGGSSAAMTLRQEGFAGTVAIVTDETSPPYERPPLSKDYLAQEKPFERILIRPESYWRERQVELLLGRRVTAVHPAERQVSFGCGERLAYGEAVVVPFPHPSGVSRWMNPPENRARVEQAVELVRAELRALAS